MLFNWIDIAPFHLLKLACVSLEGSAAFRVKEDPEDSCSLSLALMELSKYLGTGCVTSSILLSFSWTIFYLPFVRSYLPPHPPVVLPPCSLSTVALNRKMWITLSFAWCPYSDPSHCNSRKEAEGRGPRILQTPFLCLTKQSKLTLACLFSEPHFLPVEWR